MNVTKINQNWTLQPGGYSFIPGMQAEHRAVQLPHDFVIESDVRPDGKNSSNTGFFNGGTYTYTKRLTVPAEWDGQRILLNFDGVMGNAKLTVNGQHVLVHHYGYTPFAADISPYLYYGEENRISVTVSNDAEQNGRWYTGGGIYRDVTLLTAPQVHIAPNGLFVHTDHFVGDDAFVTVETTMENHTAKDRCAWVELSVTEDGGETVVAQGKIKVFLPAGKSAVARTQLCIENVKRWDVDAPHLYALHAKSSDGKDFADEANAVFV